MARRSSSLDHPVEGATIGGEHCIVRVGFVEGGTGLSVFGIVEGDPSPAGFEFGYQQALELHAQLGSALDSVRRHRKAAG
jgi:hypothetical protein